MIPSEQTEAFLIQNFPEIERQLNKREEKNKPFYNMSCFATFTQLHIQYGNFDVVKRCFEIANDLIINGDETVKNAVENCYLQQLNLEGIAQQQLVGYLPGKLRSSYRNTAKTAA